MMQKYSISFQHDLANFVCDCLLAVWFGFVLELKDQELVVFVLTSKSLKNHPWSTRTFSPSSKKRWTLFTKSDFPAQEILLDFITVPSLLTTSWKLTCLHRLRSPTVFLSRSNPGGVGSSWKTSTSRQLQKGNRRLLERLPGFAASTALVIPEHHFAPINRPHRLSDSGMRANLDFSRWIRGKLTRKGNADGCNQFVTRDSTVGVSHRMIFVSSHDQHT